MSTELDAPDSTMNHRERMARSIPVAIAVAYAFLTVVPPFLMKQDVTTFNNALPAFLAGGVIFFGIWGMISTAFKRDPDTRKPVAGRGIKALLLLPTTALATAITWMGAHYAMVIGGDDQTSYHFHKTGAGVVVGLAGIIAYAMVLQMFASARVVRKLWWLVVLILLVVSIAAPWWWSGAKVGADYY